jgi:hypothetical protein
VSTPPHDISHPSQAADPVTAIPFSRDAWNLVVQALGVAADWTENDTDETEPDDRTGYLTQIDGWRHLSTVITAALTARPDSTAHRTPPPAATNRLDAADTVVADVDLLDQLMTDDAPDDAAQDSLAEFRLAVDLIDGRSREFGSDVAVFLDQCLRFQLLDLPHTVREIRAEPTVLAEARDGGYLLLVHLRNGVTLASHRQRPDLDPGTPAARQVLTAVAATANQVLAAYQTSR